MLNPTKNIQIQQKIPDGMLDLYPRTTGTQVMLETSDYNPDSTYAIGDCCIYSGAVYICRQTTTGSWDSGNWIAISSGMAVDVQTELYRLEKRTAKLDSYIPVPPSSDGLYQLNLRITDGVPTYFWSLM